MIEETIIKYLGEKLAPVPVLAEYPDGKTIPCVFIEKTGSGENNGIRSATIALQSLADSLYNAAVLNEQVKEAAADMIELDEICRVSLNSDYNFTDIQTKQYRYQAVYDITYY